MKRPLYYFRSRYIDTGLGRFTGRDTIGTWGEQLNFGNAYSYVGNRPSAFADPYGLKAFKKCDKAVKSEKKCGVESFEVKWKKHRRAGASRAWLRIDVAIKFKKDAKHDPCCREYRQNAANKWKVTAGPQKGSRGKAKMEDDDYSRADDTDGNKA